MSWGILFRHEVILNYARIQDIHLRSNIVERWLGLARVLIQTASSSSAAEMTIEGIKNFEEVRDFLYSRMRGVKDAAQQRTGGSRNAEGSPSVGGGDELAATLRDLAVELRALRETIERSNAKAPGEKGTGHV